MWRIANLIDAYVSQDQARVCLVHQVTDRQRVLVLLFELRVQTLVSTRKIGILSCGKTGGVPRRIGIAKWLNVVRQVKSQNQLR
jgi:hypothetical protein